MPTMKLRKDPPQGYFTNPPSPTNSSAPSDGSYSSASRPSSNATNLTVPTTVPSDDRCHRSHSCSLDAGDWFAQFHDELDASDDLPTGAELDSVANIPLYDAEGNSRPFKSLYSGDNVIGERQLVIFVRHFYCGACQAYLKALTQSIDPQTYFTMTIPTSIVIIGCGSPELIPHYKAVTGTLFPIFTDPSRKLFKGLSMGWTLDIGKKRPDYMKDISPPAWLAGQVAQVSKVKGFRKKFKGGNPVQVGGEFLFSDEEVVWCHRMKDYRNHTEMETLRRVLQIDG